MERALQADMVELDRRHQAALLRVLRARTRIVALPSAHCVLRARLKPTRASHIVLDPALLAIMEVPRERHPQFAAGLVLLVLSHCLEQQCAHQHVESGSMARLPLVRVPAVLWAHMETQQGC